MTIGEIIQRVESTLVSGLPAELRGSYISHRWIYSVLKSMRSRILIQKRNKRQKISSWNMQTICLPLDIVSEDVCGCMSGSLCLIKGTERIPDILVALSNYMITSVTSNGNKIDIIDKNAAKYNTYSRYTNSKPVAFIHDGRIFVKNAEYIDYVEVTAVFDDPAEAGRYVCGADDDCCADIRDSQFPIDNDLADTCIMMTIQEISMAFLKQNNNEREESNEKED